MWPSILVATVLAACGAAYSLSSELTTVERQAFDAQDLNQGELSSIGTLPMPEVKKRLNYLISESSDALEAFDQLKSLRLELTSESAGPSELQFEELFVPFPTAQLKAALASIQDLQFAQPLFDKGSLVRIDSSSLDALWKRAAMGDQPVDPRERLEHLRFRDGSQQAFVDVQAAADPDADQAVAELTVNKPLDSVGLTISYSSYPAFKTVVLDKEHPEVSLNDGQRFQLTALGDGNAALRLSTLKMSTFVVQGLTDTGRALQKTNSSSNAFPSDTEIQALRSFHKSLLQTKADLRQFATSLAVQQHLERLAESLHSNAEPMKATEARFGFAATPQRIVIHVLDPLERNSFAAKASNVLPAQPRYIARDVDSELYGFIDQSGQWVVKPQFHSIREGPVAGSYAMRTLAAATASSEMRRIDERLAYFPAGSHKISYLPFEYVSKTLKDGLLLVQRESNGPYGLYDFKNHRFTLPMKFVNPTVTDNLFIARIGEKTYTTDGYYGAYTLAGKQILAPQFFEIKREGDFLHTQSIDRSRHDVFDLKGQPIKP